MTFSHRSRFTRSELCIAIALSVMTSNASAEDASQLDQVVVTASRTAQTVDEALAPVTVIDREQIERSQATSVSELLSQAPGVQITYNGGPGSNTGVYIRGTRTAQSLILVDGHKINSANSGSAPLEYLDPDQIERIEIVRGPRSVLYGADAIGGVINIITKKGTGKPQLTLKAGGGSRNTGEYGLNFSGQHGNSEFNFGARLFETQGIDRTVNQLGSDSDDDAYRNKSFSGSLKHEFGNIVQAGLNFYHSKGKAEYDNGSSYSGYPIGYFDVTGVNTYVSAEFSENWKSTIDVGFVNDERNDVGGQYGDSLAKSKRYSVSWLNDISWLENQLLIAGVDYADEDVKSTRYTKSRDNLGVFAQNSSFFDGYDIQVGGRYDNNELYGNTTTGSVAFGIELPRDMRLIASYGTAFRAPTLSDLNSNPKVKPEESKNAELELRGRLGEPTDWSVSLYRNDMTNMLLWNGNFTENTDAEVAGLEVTTSTIINTWQISSNLSILKPEYSNGINKGNTLYRRATELFNLNIDKDFGRWALGGTFRAQGSTWNDQANKQEVPGFGTFDLRATVKLAPGLKAQFKAINLLDKEYTTTRSYEEEPFGVFATVIWSPEL